MNPYDVKRAFIQTAVSHGIADIERAPHQTIRKLADWGCQFARGRFQKNFFASARSRLASEDSAYYTIIENLVRRVNHRTLRTFGINVGYNAWTMGASMIRDREAADGYNIPWLVQFRDFSGEGALNTAAMAKAIEEGETIGIYACVITAVTPQALRESCALAEKFPDHAFWILSDTACFSDIPDPALTGLHNTMFVIRSDGAASRTLCAGLTGKGCLAALYAVYDSAADILSGRWKEGLADSKTSFFFFLADEHAGEEEQRRVADYAVQERETPSMPVFAVALFEDVLRVDRIISGEPCFLSMGDNGEASSIGQKGVRRSGNLLSLDFLALLRAIAPRVGYTT